MPDPDPPTEPAPPAPPAPEAWRPGDACARRRLARKRGRLLAALALLAPAIWTTGGDIARRGRWILHFDARHAVGYVATSLLMALVWGAALYAASTRRGLPGKLASAAFVLLFTLPAAVQPATYALYRQYGGLDTGLYIDSIPWIVAGTLPLRAPVVARFVAALLVSILLVVAARRLVRPRRVRRKWRILLAVPAAALPFAGGFPVSYQGLQSTSPDLIYYEGVSYAIGDHIRRFRTHNPALVRLQGRSPAALPALKAAPARPRNVFLVLQEAQRADVTCSAFSATCGEANIGTNVLLPDRLPLLQMRSLGSSTAVCVFSLFSGLHPLQSRERFQTAPFLWDYAHAAGYDTAFWSSQMPMFSNYRLLYQDLPLSHRAMGAEIDPDGELLAGASDELLTDRVIHDFDELKEPFFAVVQYSNIHHPRVVDPKRSPFHPANRDKRSEFRNFYKNVVYLSDRAVTRLLAHIRGSEAGKRTVIVYTADHGEAMWEHKNENFHSATVYEEEIRVPAWIDAPKDTLAPEEERAVRRARTDQLFQTDLGATMLDLLGLWDAPELARFHEGMSGRPVTRPLTAAGPMPLTNVCWSWEYAFPNWGMMEWPYKIFAGPKSKTYECYDLRSDPRETKDLGEARCAKLVGAASQLFGMMPAAMADKSLAAWPDFGRR